MAYPVHCYLFRSPWGCRAKCRMLCMSTVGFLDMCQSNPYQSPAHTVRPLRLPPCVRISSLSESHTCHTQLGLSDNQMLSIPTWGYDTSIEPLRALNTCWIRWSPKSGQTVHPVAPWILRIPATIQISIAILKPCSYAIVWAHPYSLVGVCLMKLNRVGADGSLSSQRSESVVRSGAKWGKLTMVIANCIC